MVQIKLYKWVKTPVKASENPPVYCGCFILFYYCSISCVPLAVTMNSEKQGPSPDSVYIRRTKDGHVQQIYLLPIYFPVCRQKSHIVPRGTWPKSILTVWQSDLLYSSFYLFKFVPYQNKLFKYKNISFFIYIALLWIQIYIFCLLEFKASQNTFKSWLGFLDNN